MGSEASSNAIYDGLVDSYTGGIDPSYPQQLKRDLVLAYLDKSGHVLDIGCAGGAFLPVVGSPSRQVVGLDINASLLDVAKKRIHESQVPNVGLVRGSAVSLPFHDSTFELAYCFSTLLLVDRVDLVINDIVRVLKPQGIAILDFAGKWNIGSVHWKRWYGRQGHSSFSVFTRRGAEKMLTSRGLSISRVRSLGVLTQFRYVPYIQRVGFLDSLLAGTDNGGLDARLSSKRVLRSFASRWYVVARKPG